MMSGRDFLQRGRAGAAECSPSAGGLRGLRHVLAETNPIHPPPTAVCSRCSADLIRGARASESQFQSQTALLQMQPV